MTGSRILVTLTLLAAMAVVTACGRRAGLDTPYEAAVHFTFASKDALDAALGSSGTAAVMADVPNYTNITPVIQTSEVVQ